MERLLTREDFRNGVFARDGHRCVICGQPSIDAHHIIERRLFSDGGYYISNGASLCSHHHLMAESTELGCDEIRRAARITKVIKPSHIETDVVIDKWGNEILPNGKRIRGELFEDESVQKVIRPVIHLFEERVRYPRTPHFPWSYGIKKGENIIDPKVFMGREVVVTLKMDGENTTMARDYIHARSPSGNDHPSRHWVKNLHSRIAHEIPSGWRICGENLYAKHSIHYTNLHSYFQVISIWDGMMCMDWLTTLEYCAILGLEVVPVIQKVMYDEIDFDWLGRSIGETEEGYVVRVTNEFHYRDFRRSVAKYVRPNHLQTHNHWAQQMVVNGLSIDNL